MKKGLKHVNIPQTKSTPSDKTSGFQTEFESSVCSRSFTFIPVRLIKTERLHSVVLLLINSHVFLTTRIYYNQSF